MQGNPQHSAFDAAVLGPLRRLAGMIRRYMLLEGVATCLAIGVLLATAHLMLDKMLILGVGPRVALLVLLAAFAVYQIRLRLVRPMLVPLRALDVAALIERKHPDFRDRLVSAVAFATGGPVNPRRDSPEMVEALIRQSGERFAGLTVHDALRRSRHLKFLGLGAAALAVCLIAVIGAPDLIATYVARDILLRDVPWPSKIDITLEGFADGKLRWPIGDELIVVATARNEVPNGLRAEFRAEDADASIRGMDRRGENQFSVEFGPLIRTMQVRLLIERWGVDEATQWYDIIAVDRPSIRSAEIRITPPPYADSPTYSLPAGQTGGDVLRGARVRIDAMPSKRIVKAALHVGGTQFAPAEIAPDGKLIAEFEPTRTGAYYFEMEDAEGYADVRPITFPLRVITDPAPKVRLALPGAGEMVVPNAVLDLAVEAEDNLGMRSLTARQQMLLEATTQPTTQPGQVEEPLPAFVEKQARYRQTSPWPLERFALEPGARIVVQVRAADYQPDFEDAAATRPAETAALPGPGYGESSAYTLRIVTREEMLADLGRREHEWRREFEQVIKAQEQINSRTMDLIDLARRGDTPPEVPVRFGQESRAQRQQAGRMKAVRSQFEQLLAEYRINQLASAAIRRRMEEGVIKPLTQLIGNEIIEASDLQERLRSRYDPAVAETLERLQVRIVQMMYGILANMLKWEGYNEAVALLQDLIKMQGDVSRQTQARLEAEIEKLFGTEPTTQPETQP